jgi:LCP family protein required for cell wall assembly
VSRAVGDPGRDGGGSRDAPDRARRGRANGSGGAPLTVEQLLARQGVDTGSGRRAARRAADDARPTASPRPADVRNGLPPVPGGVVDDRPESSSRWASPIRSAAAAVPVEAPARRAGLPPVPAGARSASVGGPPPMATPARPAPTPLPPHPSLPLPDLPFPEGRPVRRTGPVPPLPGLTPAAPPAAPGRTRAPRRERSPGRRRLVRAVVALTVVLGLLALYHLGLYFYVDRSIGRVDALAPTGPEVLAPALQEDAQTYLVVGTDVPGQEGASSVTALLASVSPDGERAVLLSLPPTALTDTPQCRTPDGELREPRTEAFASALLQGGPSCMVRAVQQLSGLRVDHYLALDLDRLPGMVDALGGIRVCVPGSVAAATADVPLPAGTSSVGADQVAGWLRPGDTGADVTGSAVSRRAQLLLTSTLRTALTTGTLADPVTLTRFLSRASDALTVDQQTTLGDLRELASSLGSLSGSAVQRAELPVEKVGYVPAGSETAHVLLDPTATGTLFETVIRDARVPSEILDAQAGAEEAAAAALAAAAPGAETPAPAPEAPETPAAEADVLDVPPSAITVDVFNGTATTGLAATVADQLAAQGFVPGEVGNEPGQVSGTVVRHGPGAVDRARTVAAAVPGAVLQPSDAVGDRVQLVIGSGFTAVTAVQLPATPPAAAAEPSSAGGEEPAPTSPEPQAAAASCG